MLLVVLATEEVSSQTSVKEWSDAKMKELYLSQVTREGHFLVTVVPVGVEHLIALSYPGWVEKRYTQETIIQKAAAMKVSLEGRVNAVLIAKFTGDIMSSGKTDLSIPRDLAEYVFLENDAGGYVRCEQADIPVISTVNMLNQSVSIQLAFPNDATSTIFAETREVTFQAGGLGLEKNRFSWPWPFHSLYANAPIELRSLYVAIGLWDEAQFPVEASRSDLTTDSGGWTATRPAQSADAEALSEAQSEIDSLRQLLAMAKISKNKTEIERTEDDPGDEDAPGMIAVVSMTKQGKKGDTMDGLSVVIDGVFFKKPGRSHRRKPSGGYMGVEFLGVSSGIHRVKLRTDSAGPDVDRTIRVEVEPGKVTYIRMDWRLSGIVVDDLEIMEIEDWENLKSGRVLSGEVFTIEAGQWLED
jgi:hypothetical protein